jgi:hypothetical protein
MLRTSGQMYTRSRVEDKDLAHLSNDISHDSGTITVPPPPVCLSRMSQEVCQAHRGAIPEEATLVSPRGLRSLPFLLILPADDPHT